MKQILIVDETPLFRDYLKDKLLAEKIVVEIAHNKRESFVKLHSLMPQLLIYNASIPYQELIAFLKQKYENINTKKIPIILVGDPIVREKLSELALYNVIKYFSRPIKIDVLCETIGRIVGKTIPLDITRCVMELHVNNDIVFIEISKGLNREKLSLLKYRIVELLDSNKLEKPQIILMMTDLRLSFMDGSNLEILLNNILYDKRVRAKNIKVLSFDNFTKKLIMGHSQYSEIEVVADITSVLNNVINEDGGSDTAEMVNEKILSSTQDSLTHGTIQLAFLNDQKNDSDRLQAIFGEVKIAIVDDDDIVRAMLGEAFKVINCKLDLFDSSVAFMIASNNTQYDLVILDIYMPGLSGFDVLINLREKKYPSPVIIYSIARDRSEIIKALSLGAKKFLVKSSSTGVVVEKAMEILKSSI